MQIWSSLRLKCHLVIIHSQKHWLKGVRSAVIPCTNIPLFTQKHEMFFCIYLHTDHAFSVWIYKRRLYEILQSYLHFKTGNNQSDLFYWLKESFIIIFCGETCKTQPSQNTLNWILIFKWFLKEQIVQKAVKTVFKRDQWQNIMYSRRTIYSYLITIKIVDTFKKIIIWA